MIAPFALLQLLADADVTTDSWTHDAKNLIFMAIFFLVAIGVAIWWLKR